MVVMARRRRVVQAGLGAALALVCVAVAVSQWDSSRGRAELVTQGAPGETNPSAIDDYCDLFSDPAECRAQRPKGKEAYWTHDEVKNELWRTMKALAEEAVVHGRY
ncbi:hypothetical protein T484DRAFT_1852079 [Baffinella frigidus]|nr:hypothetical protein T484DRAFT_1852079 [Cryptophyta sp. CCMP2293]